jgi:hypothetical protein
VSLSKCLISLALAFGVSMSQSAFSAEPAKNALGVIYVHGVTLRTENEPYFEPNQSKAFEDNATKLHAELVKQDIQFWRRPISSEKGSRLLVKWGSLPEKGSVYKAFARSVNSKGFNGRNFLSYRVNLMFHNFAYDMAYLFDDAGFQEAQNALQTQINIMNAKEQDYVIFAHSAGTVLVLKSLLNSSDFKDSLAGNALEPSLSE